MPVVLTGDAGRRARVGRHPEPGDVRARPSASIRSNIPRHIEVDVTHVAIGHSLHVSDLKLPEGVEVLDEPDATVARRVGAEGRGRADAGGRGATEAAAEPELIRKTKEEGEEEGESK